MPRAVSISPIPEAPALRELWTNLAGDSPHSFFISWHWIGTWLHCLGTACAPGLLTVYADNSSVALGIVIKRKIWRRGILPVNTWVLNATGSPQYDCICPQYNGLLARSGYVEYSWSKVLEYFTEIDRDWDEIRLEGVSAAVADVWADSGRPLREWQRTPSRFVKLAEVRATADKSCIGMLSSRARTRLRHTMASLQSRYGPLTVAVAHTHDEARNHLSELKTHHNAKWAAHQSGGAFSVLFAKRFHDALLERGFTEGVIQLARISAGPTTIGVVYNFVYQGQVLSYQNGINYQATERNESPGLLVQALMIDHNAALGHEVYDLLAGDAQYKRTLARHSAEQWWGALQAPRLKLQLERIATHHYRSLRNRVRKAGS